jgi:hypothetical protein
VSPNRYAEYLPVIANWIQETLDASAGTARSVESFHFLRLPHYFSQQLLRTTNVVILDRLPVPPLSAFGLTEFAAFETQPMSGITYLDTYFLLPGGAGDESLHFHELIHVIQWQALGPRDFLLMYAAGLAECGYLDSPLERMAYDHQRQFDSGEPPYAVEVEVRQRTLNLQKS